MQKSKVWESHPGVSWPILIHMPKLWIFGKFSVCIFGFLDFWILGFLETICFISDCILQNPKTPKIQKSQNSVSFQKYKNPKFKKSKNPKFGKVVQTAEKRNSKDWIFGFLDFWIFGFLGFGVGCIFWIFGFLDFWILGFWDF